MVLALLNQLQRLGWLTFLRPGRPHSGWRKTRNVEGKTVKHPSPALPPLLRRAEREMNVRKVVSGVSRMVLRLGWLALLRLILRTQSRSERRRRSNTPRKFPMTED
jgi:hypothetical protein